MQKDTPASTHSRSKARHNRTRSALHCMALTSVCKEPRQHSTTPGPAKQHPCQTAACAPWRPVLLVDSRCYRASDAVAWSRQMLSLNRVHRAHVLITKDTSRDTASTAPLDRRTSTSPADTQCDPGPCCKCWPWQQMRQRKQH